MPRSPKMSKKDKLNFLADIEDGYRPFDKHALALLKSLLDDPDPDVRSEAIACLWNDPDPKWIGVLMRKVIEDPHSQVRAHALSVLGRYVFEGEAATLEGWEEYDTEINAEDCQRVHEFLLHFAQDPDESLEVRRYTIESLAFRTEDPDVLDFIEWAYRHRDVRLKTSAIFAMARNGDARWTKYILAEIRSDDPEIQYEAVHAAGELGLREATSALIELARNKNVRKPLRLLSIHALGETGDRPAYPVLEGLTHSRDRDVRRVARDALETWIALSAMDEFDSEEDGLFDDDFEGYPDPDIWNDPMGTFSKN